MSFGRIRHRAFEYLILSTVFFYSVLRFLFWAMWLVGQGRRAKALSRYLMGKWCRSVFTFMGVRVDVEGLENLPREQGYVVMSNHQSKYDPILLIGFMEPGMGFVAKRELFRVPGLSFWMRQNKCMAIDRNDIRGGAEALIRMGLELKEERRGFVIFPEGGRTKHPAGEIQPFRGGSLLLAMEHQLPVVPVSLDGTRMMDKGEIMSATPRAARRIRVRIGKPLTTGHITPPQRHLFMNELRDIMIANWETIRVDWNAPPPLGKAS